MAPSDSAWQRHVELALEPAPEPEQPAGAVCLEALPDTIALLRLGRGVPDCVEDAARGGQFCAVVQEPDAATAWLPRRLLPRRAELVDEDGAEEVEPGVGWCAIRVIHPAGAAAAGTGKAAAGQGAREYTGTASALCALLAEVSISTRFLSSFGTEVLLVPEDLLPEAAAALVADGHALWPSTRVCDPVPWEAVRSSANDAPVLRQLTGAWRLVRREEPIGTVVAEYTKGEGPVRLQAPRGLFVELRPSARADGGKQREASFGGRCRMSEEDGKVVCTQLRAVDFQPPAVFAPRWQLAVSASRIEAVSHPGSDCLELWARYASTDDSGIVALELQSEVPEPKRARAGLWLFLGRRFARVLGQVRGGGLVAGTCCRSLAQLQHLRGDSEVRHEIREGYEALFGTVEEPGLLMTKRMAWHREKADEVFYSASDESTGEVVVGENCIVYIQPGGKRETWRISEW
eukprot:CAMPEP_0179227854 /NCGR_PEP_ID=MMETSP0797-20121207/9528_1 /TAXON_ID=47934 /ORGANISM="Dinophysis acuminata, Strain DAEP01" /LENGTH=460 /DNA_ID=CAMNT_0020934895 /DNA_START=1 /DNA_END=1380 /DNA_ORIENTATION=-